MQIISYFFIFETLRYILDDPQINIILRFLVNKDNLSVFIISSINNFSRLTCNS
jgi:hypothetical protein